MGAGYSLTENQQERLFVPVLVSHAGLSVVPSITLYLCISHENRIISSQLSSWSSDLNLNISNQVTHTYSN